MCYNWYTAVKGDGKTPGHTCHVAEGAPAPDPSDPKILPKELKDSMIVGVSDQYTFKYVTTEESNSIKK